MDIALVIKQRLAELRLDQKDLAAAAEVTESYVSQLLSRKKVPPSPQRTDIYEKIGPFLQLPSGELARLAQAQHQAEQAKKFARAPEPLFTDTRQLILLKCAPEQRAEVERIFSKEPFGELERLVTQKILEVAQEMAREELRNEEWLRSLAHLSGRSFEQMRVASLEFLDSDALHVSPEGCVSFLDPMIEVWRIDLATFALEIVLNSRLFASRVRRFEFLESTGAQPEPGFLQFLADPTLSSGVTPEEREFLRSLKFARRPTALYYYRELQSLRDPLHFAVSEPGVASGSSNVIR